MYGVHSVSRRISMRIRRARGHKKSLAKRLKSAGPARGIDHPPDLQETYKRVTDPRGLIARVQVLCSYPRERLQIYVDPSLWRTTVKRTSYIACDQAAIPNPRSR